MPGWGKRSTDVAERAVKSYRAPAPAAADRIVWPAAFGTRFMVHVDVEEEFDWSRPLDPANRATTAMRAYPDAHRRFADRGVPLTSFVDYPIVRDPAAVDILAATLGDGRSAIGAQLHSWVTPPLVPRTPGDSYAGNVPPALEAAKIGQLTDALTTAFGSAPLIFRSGRYGIGPATMSTLAAAGYRIDSSVRARYDYRADGGPDFRAVGNHAYRTGGLVELPFTTVFAGALRRWGATRLYDAASHIPHGPGLLARTGLLQRVSLTPEAMPAADALQAVDAALADGLRLLILSFHSPSLVPGHTPFVRDAADLARFWHWWDVVLDRLAAHGVMPADLADVLGASAAS